MPIVLSCGACGSKFNLPDNMAGRSAKCKCGAKLNVPGGVAMPARTARQPAAAVKSTPRVATDRGDPLTAIFAQGLKHFGPNVFADENVPEKLQTKIQDEIRPGERILWLGRPFVPTASAAAAGLKTAAMIGSIIILISLVIAVSPLLIPGGANVFHWILSVIFGTLGALFGTVAIVLPRFMINKPHLRECYVVTNQRAMIASFWLATKSFSPFDLGKMKRVDSKTTPGFGNLLLAKELHETGGATRSMRGHVASGRVEEIDVGFMGIDNVAAVEQLIRKALLDPVVNGLLATAPATAHQDNGQRLQEVGAASAAGAALASEDVPAHLREKIQAEFAAGERLVWIGQPGAGIAFKRLSLALVPAVLGFLFVAGGIATLILGIDRNGNGEALDALISIAQLSILTTPFLLVLAGIPLLASWKARGSCYALTNKQAFVLRRKLFGRTLDTYAPSDLVKMKRNDSWFCKGAGDLIFHSDVKITQTDYYKRHGGQKVGSDQRLSVTNYGFLNVPKARELENLVRPTLVDRFMHKLVKN